MSKEYCPVVVVQNGKYCHKECPFLQSDEHIPFCHLFKKELDNDYNTYQEFEGVELCSPCLALGLFRISTP